MSEPDEPVEEPTSVRKWLAWFLAPQVPAAWKIIDSLTLPPTIDRPTVTLTHTRIEPVPAAPLSDSLMNTVTVRVTDPHKDIERAEAALDEEVTDLIHAVKGSNRVIWESAEKVKTADDGYLAWDITIKVLSTDPPTAPPAQPEPDPAPEGEPAA
ncbi:MAG TPA: hypothetical protein VFU07_09675 [Candidatus Lumbricidophila sp.]|nr:hypothetical protein [Candidatus Lumbricidophila sp.]